MQLVSADVSRLAIPQIVRQMSRPPPVLLHADDQNEIKAEVISVMGPLVVLYLFATDRLHVPYFCTILLRAIKKQRCTSVGEAEMMVKGLEVLFI